MRKIAIFDDHRAIRDMLRMALTQHSDYEIVGEGSTGKEVIEISMQARPDVVILDMVLPGTSGVEVLSELRRRRRGLQVIFFSGSLQEVLVCQAIALGASAYVSKTAALTVLLGAIDAVVAGGTFFDPLIARFVGRAATDLEWQVLSGRERDVVRLIAQGMSTKEAATLLGISIKTLDKHRTHMMKKLHLHSAVAVTRYAIQAGLVALN